MAEHLRKTGRGNQPITRHPLFPAMVALWFGALLGLSSLAIRPELLEQAIVASGLAYLIPAAGPPLGLTARLLIAVAMAATGGAIGLAIGRVIARNPSPPRHDDLPVEAGDPLVTASPAAEPAEPDPVADDIAAPQSDTAASRGGWPEPPAVSAADRIAEADLHDLSSVELLERLALTIERVRAKHDDGTIPTATGRHRAETDAMTMPRPPSGLTHPRETERALRAALAKLQSMSGAA